MTSTYLRHFIKGFLVDDDAAVTVDWVVLTSGIVLLGVLVLAGIKTALQNEATIIATTLTDSVAAALS